MLEAKQKLYCKAFEKLPQSLPIATKKDIVLNQILKDEFSADHSLHHWTRYHLGTGGKCLRGRLAMAEAECLNIPKEKALLWAMACELLHNATLIHDDIQDNDPIRRGQPSLWKKAGLAEAINTGDFLIFRSFKLAAQLKNTELTSLLSETSELLVEGQMDELKDLASIDGSYWQSYQNMARLKTGSLFLLPIEGCYLIAEKKISKELRQAWLELGLAYQIFDDIRDFLGLKQQGQKQKDFYEKKINALLSLLSEKAENQSLVEEYKMTPAETSEFTNIVGQLEEKILSDEIIPQLRTQAFSHLENFKNVTSKNSREIILSFLDTAIEKRSDSENSKY